MRMQAPIQFIDFSSNAALSRRLEIHIYIKGERRKKRTKKKDEID